MEVLALLKQRTLGVKAIVTIKPYSLFVYIGIH